MILSLWHNLLDAVMPGRDPGIHVSTPGRARDGWFGQRDVDGRVTPGHDGLKLFAALLTALCLAVPAQAAKPARLSPQDVDDVHRAEAYLNGITSLKARFVQISPSGAAAEGSAYLQRPGLMRLDYDPPNQIQLVADGRFLIYYDKQLDQTSYIPLDDTPAGVLVRPQVRLVGGDVVVTAVNRAPGMVLISLIQARDPGAGEITLVFQERPFELKQWRVRDPQGQVTTVSLFGAQNGVRIDPGIFHFVDPQARPKFKE